VTRARSRTWLAAALLLAVVASAELGLPSGSSTRYLRPSKFIEGEDGSIIDEANVRTAREAESHTTGTPHWTNAPAFQHDVLTFARLIFQIDSSAAPRVGFGALLGWWVDFPDADLNLSWRLQELTSLRTDPDARVLRLTDSDLGDFPLLYMEHPGYMTLSDEEIVAFRAYLKGGGALFVNDFWSRREWEGFASQMALVLPGAAWDELETDHPIFHCLFDLRGPMHRLRVPTMQFWNEQFDPANPFSTPHRIYRGEGCDEMHVRALRDPAGRMIVLAIHNSDVSDGWEREGESDAYFNRFSEKIAYPLAFNILFYLMTH